MPLTSFGLVVVAERHRAFRAGVSIITGLVVLLVLMGCEKARLDAQVRDLCGKDGGIRVYEPIPLPRELFDGQGLVNFYHPDRGENALGPDYLFKEEITYYRTGNPQVSRLQYQVLRRSDGRILGETVVYGRGGGDAPGPWYESGFRCPDSPDGEPNTLLKKIFVREGVR